MIKNQYVKYNFYEKPGNFQKLNGYSKSSLNNNYKDSFISFGSKEKIIKASSDPFPVAELKPIFVETASEIEKIVDLIIKIENIELKSNYDSFIYREELLEELPNPDKLMIAVKDPENNTVAAGVLLKQDKETGHINGFHVDQKYRRKKIGSWLMNRIVNKAADLRLTTLLLEATNQNAIDLYEKYGFEKYRSKVLPNGKTMYFMSKKLLYL